MSEGGLTEWGGVQLEFEAVVCGATWRVLRLRQPMCGGWDTWHYSHWAQWGPRSVCPAHLLRCNCSPNVDPSLPVLVGCRMQTTLCRLKYPTHARLMGETGGDTFALTTVHGAVQQCSLNSYVMPALVLRPDDTQFDESLPPEVPAWHTVSGHVLVRPLIDGRDLGFMIMDTGTYGYAFFLPIRCCAAAPADADAASTSQSRLRECGDARLPRLRRCRCKRAGDGGSMRQAAGPAGVRGGAGGGHERQAAVLLPAGAAAAAGAPGHGAAPLHGDAPGQPGARRPRPGQRHPASTLP